MTQLPHEDDTPFSLPRDVPEVMPVDYPSLNGDADLHEAYDEGLDDVIDIDPYRLDDDAIKSAKRLMKAGIAGKEFYTLDHDLIQRWAQYRYGHPAHVKGVEDGLDRGGLYLYFKDREPDVDIKHINWDKFFRVFEKNKLAFVYRRKTRSGALSRFYRFVDRRDVERITEARRMT
jgi:hypothetical protein